MPDTIIQQEKPEEKKEEKKEPSRLENILTEGVDFLKKVFIIGNVVTLPFTYSLLGMPQQAIRSIPTIAGFAAGQAARNKMEDKPVLDGVLKRGVVGAALSYPLALTFEGLNSLETTVAQEYGSVAGKVAKGAGWLGAGFPATVLIERTLSGKIKEYTKSLYNAYKSVGLLSLINVLYISSLGVLPAMIGSAVIGGLYMLKVQGGKVGKEGMKNLYKSLNPLPYAKAAYTAAQKTAKGLYDAGHSMFRAVYEMGDNINKKYLKGGAKPSPQTPQPEPQPAPA